jgi:hypothetical protein
MSTVYAGTWVPSSSLWVAKLAYMSNCYISVDMPSALFQELCTEWYGLYAKIHMLDCDMPNAMTIAMSFRMTTEQVGYFIIYMSITRLWLSILPLQRRNYYYTTRASVYISKSQVFQYAGISWHEKSFSMPVYHGIRKVSVCRYIMAWEKFQYAGISWHEKSFSMPVYHGMSKVSVYRHIRASIKIPNHRLFRFASISRHLSITHIAVYFGMPPYHGIL